MEMAKLKRKTMGLAAFGLMGALFLSGCGSNDNASEESDKAGESTEKTYQGWNFSIC